MGYAFEHQGKGYTPEGIMVPGKTIEAHNKALEAREIAYIKTGPAKLHLYVQEPTKYYTGPGMCKPIDPDYNWKVTTWPGTIIGPCAHMGPAYKTPGFGGWPSKRRALSVVIFGILYHGTYYESSGNYCRLTRAKVQWPAWRKRHKPIKLICRKFDHGWEYHQYQSESHFEQIEPMRFAAIANRNRDIPLYVGYRKIR
jgi:hypothetical protein